MKKTPSTSYPVTSRSRIGAQLRCLLLSATALVTAGIGMARADIIPPGCLGNGYGIELFVDKPKAHIGDRLSYSLVVRNGAFPACRAEQITAAIITPDGVTNRITLQHTILNPGESDSYPNVVSYVIRQQDVLPEGLVRGAAVSSAVINQNIVNENSLNYRDVNTIIATPCINITATCAGGSGEGAPITFTGTVKNCGNIGLTGVTVTNTYNGQLVLGPIDLEPNAQATFEGSFVPATPCQGTAGLIAQGTDIITDPRTVSATTSVTCANATNPQIVVSRGCPEGAPLAGSTLAYTGTVENTGNVTLTNIVVVSDRPAANTTVFSIASLAPGASATFNASFPTPADACSVTETLTASGRDRCTGTAVTNTKTTTCPLGAAGSIRLAIACPQSPAAAGGVVTFAGTVTNPGDVTLQNIVVVNDAVPGTPVFTLGTLAPKASATFSTTVTAPQNACEVAAAFTVTATDRCETAGVRDTTSATCPVSNSPAIAITHGCPAEGLTPGATATFSGTVSNAGNIALNDVRVFQGDALVFGPASLEPGQSANFTASVTAPADTCSVTPGLTARGTAKCSEQVVTSTSTQSCPVTTTPQLVVTKACPEVAPPAGGQITYSGTVRNTGNVTLTDVVVQSAGATVFGPVTLAPGATTPFTASASVPVNACSVTDTWTASGKDKCSGVVVSNSATTTCPVATTPKIVLTVTCPSGAIAPSSTALFNGTVANQGTITLTGITVVRQGVEGAPVFTLASLAPGASANFTVDVPAGADTCSVSIGLSASASGQCEGAATDTASVTCAVTPTPAIAVTHSCPPEPAFAGEPTSYTGRVSNTGNITLTNVVVVHSLSGNTPVVGPITLAPGEAKDFSGTYTVAPGGTGCTYVSQVTATGAGKCGGTPVTAQNQNTCPVQFVPGLEIIFICPDTLYAQGEHLHYKAIIKNVGNVRLENVRVYDSLTGNNVVWERDSLSVGEVHQMENTRIIPENCCTVTTTLRAVAYDTCMNAEVVDTTTGTCPIKYNPRIVITKSCPTTPVEPGGNLTYSGTVRNTGDITLADVNVVSRNGESTVKILGPIALAPGQVVNYTASYPLPAGSCGDDVVTATARACNNQTNISASVSTKCPVKTAPAIVVTKGCPTLPVASGEVFTYTGSVINTGTATLTDVVVVDNRPSEGTKVFGPATLAPGESKSFTGSYKLDTICCETWDTLTATARDQCTGQQVQNSSTVICPVLWSPRISITKQCRSGNQYAGVVKNTGAVTLTNVTVTANLGEGGTKTLLGPIELAPGETKNYSGTASGDVMVTATAISLCQGVPVVASATCAGEVPNETLAIDDLKFNGDQVSLSWKSIPGRFYRVEYKTAAGDAQWQAVEGEVQATSTTATKIDVLSTDGQRYYRVMMLD